MGTPNKYKSEYCEKAEEILSKGKSLAAVCAHISIGRSTLYEWRDNHPEFREAVNRGMQKCQAFWEDLGFEGMVGNFDKFNSTPWIFTMKNRFREDYQEDKEVKPVSETLVEKLIDRLVD
jgi:hypothetical protein